MPVANSGRLAAQVPMTVKTHGHGEHERHRPELHGGGESAHDERRDRGAVSVRAAHVAGHEMADPVPVPDRERPIEPELVIEIGHAARIRKWPENRAPDIAGEQLARGEYQHAEEPQRRNRQRGTPGDECADPHRRLSSSRGKMR